MRGRPFALIAFLALVLFHPNILSSDALNEPINDLEQSIECLAKNIYFEARGEGYRGMLAVAHVTINRTKSNRYPNDICSVVYQKNQFTWTAFRVKITDSNIYERAKTLAYEVLHGHTKDPTHGALNFHNKDVLPDWNKLPKAIIGNHLFY